MAEAGKSAGFATLMKLTSKVKAPDTTVSTIQKTVETEPVQKSSAEQTAPVPVVEKAVPRIPTPHVNGEMESEIRKIAEAAAKRIQVDMIYGRRSTFKGVRVSRTYKISLQLDKWLDAFQEETHIEKSAFVCDAILDKLQKDYAHLKPIEQPQE